MASTLPRPPTYTRVALAGNAQGIGRAIALRLTKDGLDVAVNDIPLESEHLQTVVPEIKQMGRKAIALTCDVSQEEVKDTVDQTVAELGRLDVMIANAAVGNYFGKVVEGFAGVPAYSMSKAAVLSLTQVSALELAEHKIMVNAYAPGMTKTRLVVSEFDKDMGGEPGDAIRRNMKLPRAKLMQPEDVASIVAKNTAFLSLSSC